MGIGEFIRARQAQGMADEAILSLVRREFPQAKTTLNSIRWYRWKDRSGVKPNGNRLPTAPPMPTPAIANTDPGQRGGIALTIFKKAGIEALDSFKRADAIATELRSYLDQAEVQYHIRERHVLGANSGLIQELVLAKALALGFESEKTGLSRVVTSRA
jgi:hypothetical protein